MTAHLYCSQAKSYGRKKTRQKRKGVWSKDVESGQANGRQDMHMNVLCGERRWMTEGATELGRQIRNEGVKPTAVPRPRLIKWNDANSGVLK